jgi:hypothetical protein
MDLDHLYVFSLEVTGVHDLKHLEASRVCQYRRMFKLVLHIDRARYPQLFEGAAERASQKDNGRTETLVQLEVTNDGSVNLIKTSFNDNQTNKPLPAADKDEFTITSKIITIQKQEGATEAVAGKK